MKELRILWIFTISKLGRTDKYILDNPEEFGLKIPPKVPMNISGERIATAATPFGYGADYVSENRNLQKLIMFDRS